MSDAFDAMAEAVRDYQRIFRGDSMPHTSDPERIANGKRIVKEHTEALARLMREGGTVEEFRRETSHIDGGGSHRHTAEMIIALSDPAAKLTGEQCWNFILRERDMPASPWPGEAKKIGKTRNGGRKPKWDWGPFEAKALTRIEHHGGLELPDYPKTDCADEMDDWANKNMVPCPKGNSPSRSTIERHIEKANRKYLASKSPTS